MNSLCINHFIHNSQIRSSNEYFVSNWSSPVNIIEPGRGGSTSGDLPTAVVAGIAVGVVVAALVTAVVVILAVLICRIYRRRAKLLKSLKVSLHLGFFGPIITE